MSELIYFENKSDKDKIISVNSVMAEVVRHRQKQQKNKKSKKKETRYDRNYPLNCISRFYPYAKLADSDVRQHGLVLPCGFQLGPSWGALKKCWKGYKLAKAQNDRDLMVEYANRIQKLELEIGIPTASFPNLGIMGDIFFLYNKDKERELRVQYYNDNIACDAKDMSFIKKMINEGTEMRVFKDKQELMRETRKERWHKYESVVHSWIRSKEGSEMVKALDYKFMIREKEKQELRSIKEELKNMTINREKYLNISIEEKANRVKRRRDLMHQKILLESKLNSINATTVVQTDTGWAYARQIIKENYFNKKERELVGLDGQLDIEGGERYYLTDVEGKRLGNYKEEYDLGFKEYDEQYRRLYLEDKIWHLQQKINSNYNY